MRYGQMGQTGENRKRIVRPTSQSVMWIALMILLVSTPAHAAADLVLIPSLPVLVSLLVLFVILIVPLNVLIFKPILDVLEERERRTSGARERSDEIAREADEVLARYRSELAAARSEAEKTRREAVDRAREEQQRQTAAARAEAEQKVEHGQRDLADSLEGARTELNSHVRDLASSAAQQILGRTL